MKLPIVLCFCLFACLSTSHGDARKSPSRSKEQLHKKNKRTTPLQSSKKSSDLYTKEKKYSDVQKKCRKAVPNNFTPKEIDDFCEGITSVGPIDCVKQSRTGNVKLLFSEILALCKDASSNHAIDCYKALPSKERKQFGIELCSHANSSLQYRCWKDLTSISGLVRKVRTDDILTYCSHVVKGEEQIECMRSALRFDRLSFQGAENKCKNVEVSLNEVRSSDNLVDSVHVDDQSVDLCLNRAKTLDWPIQDSNTLCSAVGSPSQAAIVLQCAVDINKMRVMESSDIGNVCRSAGIVEEKDDYAESKYTPSIWDSPQRGRVASCVFKSYKEITTSSSMRTRPDPDLVIKACGASQSPNTGSCIASFSNKKMEDSITSKALLDLCTSRNGLSKTNCLKMQKALRPSKSHGPYTPEEVKVCVSAKSKPQSLRLLGFESLSDSQQPNKILSGQFFSLTFEMVDQWGDVMTGSDDPIRVTIEVEKGHHSDHGAVLFGKKTNSSVNGQIIFSHLMVSQPGPIQLKITMENLFSEQFEDKKDAPFRILLHKFLVDVSENPNMVVSNECLFIFNELQCPVAHSKNEVDSWLEQSSLIVKGTVHPKRVFHVLSCMDVFASWAVEVHILPISSVISGDVIDVSHRAGIEAVWTGQGMPRAEMNSYERLDIPTGSKNLKQIRNAYHKKSLQWHPDRWSSIIGSIKSSETLDEVVKGEIGPAAVYKVAVQEAFELIAAAYEQLLIAIEHDTV